jgi:peptidyl-prolyl cis-trans isomerase A (cyclophilin A)
MIRRLIALFALLLTANAADAASPPVRVVLETSQGPITVELAMKQAPITAGNFLKYVEQKKFDGTVFYRAARTKNAPGKGFVQGGTQHSIRRSLPPIAHEPTSKTGLRHVDGTISMARGDPGSAMGDFFITVGAAPGLDAKPGNPGFAAFGRVVKGMDIVRKMLAQPTIPNAGSGAMRGQYLAKRVPIITAHRAK